MRFHVLLPGCVHTPTVAQPWELGLTGADVVHVGRVADELGFDGVLVPEHLLMARRHLSTAGAHFVDATTTQAVVAGATSRVRVGSMLTILPLHHPVAMAKALCTLDWLSSGRAMVCFGLGWQREELRALGVPWDERAQVADEYLAALIELLDNDQPSFQGRYVSFADIAFEPRPVQRPHPPIWVGGDSPPALRRAARFGDGWAPWLTPPAEIPAKLDRLRSARRADQGACSVYYSLQSLNVGYRHEAADGYRAGGRGDEQRVIDDCARLAALGVTDTSVPPPALSGIEAFVDHLAWLAADVIPACRQR